MAKKKKAEGGKSEDTCVTNTQDVQSCPPATAPPPPPDTAKDAVPLRSLVTPPVNQEPGAKEPEHKTDAEVPGVLFFLPKGDGLDEKTSISIENLEYLISHEDDFADGDELSKDIDKNWAWMVLLAGFLSFCALSGLYNSVGIYYVYFLNEFGQSKGYTATTTSMFMSFFFLGGPLASYFILRHGCRATVMGGGVLAALGYIGTYLAPTLETVLFTYGVFTALGLSLNFSGWVIALGTYFQVKHGIATALAMTGFGAGLFFLGPLMEANCAFFGWRGSMIINAGISLQFVVFGAMVYPIRVDLQGPNIEEDFDDYDEEFDERDEDLMVRDTSKSSITERPPTPPPQRASPLSTPKKRKLTPMPAATSEPPFVATKRSGLRKRTPPSRPELNRQKSFTFTPGMVDPSSVKSLSRSIQSIQSSAASAISSSIHSSVKDINFSPSATFLSHSIRHLSENRQNYFAGRRKSLSMYSLPQMGKSKKTSTTDRAPRSPTGSDVIPELPRCRSATFSAGCKIEDLVSARTRKGSVDSSSLEIKKSIKRRGVEFGPSEVETIESIPLEETRKTSNEGVPGFFYYSPAYLKRRFTVIAEADESEEKAEAAPQPPTNSTISILRRYSREAMSLLSVPLHRGSAQAHDEEKALEDIPAHDPSRRYSRLTKILEMASRFRGEEGIEEEDEKKPGILDKISQAIDDVPQFTGVQGAFQASLIRDPRFWCFNFAGLVGIMGTLTLYVLYKDFAISKNLEERFVYVLSAIGLGDLLGRLFAVMFVSWTFFNPLFVYALIQCLTGAIVLYHVSVETIEQLVVCCLGLGLCYGMQNVLLAVAPGKVYGPTNLTTTFGYILFWCGIGAFLGPPIAGALVDESAANGYTYAFVFIGTASMLGGLALFICYALDKRWRLLIQRREKAAAAARRASRAVTGH